MRLRRASDEDRPGIAAVHVRAIREVCARSYPAEQIAAWSGLLSPESYRGVVRERLLLVAEQDQAIVGFGQLDPASAEVEAVYVLPERQREGIGAALLGALENGARADGLPALHLSATLNAVKFYEAAGYVGEGPVVHELPGGGELACLRMSKRLS